MLYNPEGSELRIQQLRMLDLLQEFDKFCTENGLRYWLSSGTCLGAVRHNGFIPWDDDVDVEMPINDFRKLLRLYKENDNYVIQTWKNDKYFTSPFAKFRDKHTLIYDSLYKYRGVFIDIFPMEYTNKILSMSCSIIRNLTLNRIYEYLKRVKYRKGKFSFIQFHIVSTVFLATKYLYFSFLPVIRIFGKTTFHKKLRHTYGVGWCDNVRFEKDIKKKKKLPFENLELNVPGDYKSYLKNIFGSDYMNIPDEKDIPKPHAQYIVFLD